MKTISKHDYNMIKITKSGSDIPVIDRLQKYLKEDYLGNINYLNMYDLYKHLAKTFINVSDKSDIESILIRDIPEISLRKFFNKKDKNISEEDLCNLLISKLELLKMREDGKDIYCIDTKNGLIPYSEYENNNLIILPKKRLMIDMDDVIVTNYFLSYINLYLGTNYVESDFKDFYMQNVIPEHLREDFFDYFLSNDIYKYAVISEGAKEVLKDLNDRYELYIGTSYIFKEAMEKSGIVLLNKHNFLVENFPYLNPNNFIFGSNKEVLNMDIKIDDKLSNLKGAKEKLLYTAYHNEDLSNAYLRENDVKRVEDFDDIKKLLLI